LSDQTWCVHGLENRVGPADEKFDFALHHENQAEILFDQRLFVFIFIETVVTLAQKLLLKGDKHPFDHTFTEFVENVHLL
jgi:hypothetical protein